jgi:hypothetical protein
MVAMLLVRFFLLHLQELLVVDRQLVEESFGERALEE